jgi:hypothetical protein
LAPAGTGKLLGQFGGSLPSRETDTWPSGVFTWKLLDIVVVDWLEVLLLEQLAAARRTQPTTPATRTRSLMVCS